MNYKEKYISILNLYEGIIETHITLLETLKSTEFHFKTLVATQFEGQSYKTLGPNDAARDIVLKTMFPSESRNLELAQQAFELSKARLELIQFQLEAYKPLI